MTTEAAATPGRPGIGPWVVPLLALAVFINYVDRGNLATAAPLLKDELKLSATEVGLLLSAFFWTYTPGLVLAGWLADRFDAYRLLAGGLVVWSAATLLSGFAGGFAALLALRLVLGLGESVALPSSSSLIARHVPADRLGAANGLIVAGLSLGPAVGIFFGGLMMAHVGWRGAFVLFGAVSLVWLVPWFVATRKLARGGASEATGGPSFGDILRRPEAWGAALGHFCTNYGFYFLVSWVPLYLVQVHGYSLEHMATVGGALYLLYAASSFAGGWASDRWIQAGGAPNRVRKTFFVACHLVGAASLLACALAPPAMALAGLFVTGMAFGAVGPHIYATAQTLAGPQAAGKWIGVQNGVGNFAGILGPIVTGLIVDRTGGFAGAFALTGAVVLLGVVGWAVMIRRIAPVGWEGA